MWHLVVDKEKACQYGGNLMWNFVEEAWVDNRRGLVSCEVEPSLHREKPLYL
jgi:hypothetical protein